MTAALLLGRDHQDYGQIHTVTVTERVAASISVGNDPDSPSLVYKADPDVLNEDALCIATDGNRTALAIADAHFGPESSHVLIERLHRAWSNNLPTSLAELHLLIASLGSVPSTESETALLLAVHDAGTGDGFGLSVGDTTLLVIGPEAEPTPRNPRNWRYVATDCRGDAEPFTFTTRPNDVVLAFTDGIDECHYRRPETSVQPHHIQAVVESAPSDPTEIVQTLSQLALSGVDGHPGGQDNIAVIAVLA